MERPTDLYHPNSKALWDKQLSIGWRNALGGSLSHLWKEIQQQHYALLGRKWTGARWVRNLIQQLWLISWDQWEDRNKKLHDSPLADDLSGALSLNRSIRNEWIQGTLNMPKRVRKTFPKKVERLLNKPLETRKQWFTLVRSYREMVGNNAEDEFSPPSKKTKKLRHWVGLR